MLKTHLVPSVMKAQPLPWGVLTSHSFVLCLLWLPLPPRPSLPPFHWSSPFHSASSFSPLSSSCLPVFSSASSSLSPTTIFFPLFLSLLALPPPSAARSLTELRARNTRATVALPQKVGVCGRRAGWNPASSSAPAHPVGALERLPPEALSHAQEAVLGPWGRSLAAEMSGMGVAGTASDLVRAATGDGAEGGRVRGMRGCV